MILSVTSEIWLESGFAILRNLNIHAAITAVNMLELITITVIILADVMNTNINNTRGEFLTITIYQESYFLSLDNEDADILVDIVIGGCQAKKLVKNEVTVIFETSIQSTNDLWNQLLQTACWKVSQPLFYLSLPITPQNPKMPKVYKNFTLSNKYRQI